MNEVDLGAFTAMFQDACLKCYGHAVREPLTETESRLLYNKIFDDTGLVVGWKSIKNYSFFLLSVSTAKPENPSVATLDTLSRYVTGAPYTTETERKKTGGHYPYWYQYRAQWAAHRSDSPKPVTGDQPPQPPSQRKKSGFAVWLLVGGVIIIGLVLFIAHSGGISRKDAGAMFTDNFHSLAEDSLAGRGWWVVSKDTAFWKRRDEQPGFFTLYTLKGDYWPDSINRPIIRNLLLRRIPCDCFTLELHLKDFIPHQNWQQAGILLSEDTGFSGKSMRISIAYNDYNGIYPRSGSIILQAITSVGAGKPEEIAHIILFNADTLRRNPLLSMNLENPAIRIEKRGERFRILYEDGIRENSSFKEMADHDFPMQPHYAGLFALRGFVDSTGSIPARFSYFSLACCTQ